MSVNTNGLAFIRGANNDNTLKIVTQDMQTIDYASTVALIPSANKNFYSFAQLTGAMTITVNTALALDGSGPKWGDTLELQFYSDGTTRTVTFSTGFVLTASTLAVTASKTGNISFSFTPNGWCEISRAITV